jgi:hypothetical protein
MLLVKQLDPKNFKIKEIGYFNSLEDIIKFFSKSNTYYEVIEKFSFNSYEIYKSGYWLKNLDKKLYPYYYKYIHPIYCYTIENSKGIKFNKDFIQSEFKKYYKKHTKRNFSPNYYCWTGRKRCHRYNYHREIYTTQERRYNSAVLKNELEPNIRGKRSNLPSCWDDITRYDAFNNNWKRYRKTQYK